MVISNNIQLILNILSLGIFASMVTGIFSMIIAILNNRRLTKIEIQREQFQMDQKKYISLVSLLEELNSIEYDSKSKKEDAASQLKDTVSYYIKVYKHILHIYKMNSYLLNGSNHIRLELDEIGQLIDEMSEKYRNWNNLNNEFISNNVPKDVDNICNHIHKVRHNLVQCIKKNIDEIINRE